MPPFSFAQFAGLYSRWKEETVGSLDSVFVAAVSKRAFFMMCIINASPGRAHFDLGSSGRPR